jgi:DNA excision repair protein ERCC-6
LFERLDELREEEKQIIELNDSVVDIDNESTDFSTNLNLLGDDDDDDDTSTINDVLTYSSEMKDAYEIASHHHITDDFSNLNFSTRIDEWLVCDKFADWRQHRNFLVNRTLSDQVTFELSAFDVVPLLGGSFRVPKCLWDELFSYQREGVEWALKLHAEGRGGVLGDEMGLGKTVQIVAFLAALQISGKLDLPALVVAPSTLLRQWIRELNTWWPPLRVILLHSSSSAFNETRNMKSFLNGLYPKTHVFVTSYGTCTSSVLQKHLLALAWNSCVLDEGHKIRNPEAQITLACKKFDCLRRFALSGTPIQNNLTELWSLFDFVNPGLLGSLPLFKTELALPINVGGYSNASIFQVQTSYKCACTLRDLIKPFILRRLKRNVLNSKSAIGNDSNSYLPEKREEIVFCRITAYQRALYEAFISSEDVDAIIERRKNLLAGIDVLRKICNHPDLLDHVQSSHHEKDSAVFNDAFDEEESEEYVRGESSSNLLQTYKSLDRPRDPLERSGKLAVLDKILKLWHSQGHRVLIFCQTRQMLDLVENFISKIAAYKYLRMDGSTAIRQRLQMVDRFNSPTSPFFIFLLTTRVGGLGINLTGADRVIIYDPDWNPSTDLQARERVYRLGQTRPVSILRLITAGTIEEKIYHRQIFKQFLTQRILEDPKQTRFFRAADLHDLFELNAESVDDNDTCRYSTETEDMFQGLEEELSRKMNGKKRKNDDSDVGDSDVILDNLLDMVGVHSTLPTAGITETIRPEYLLIQREADKIAQGALEALERSRRDPPTTENSNSSFFGRFGAPGDSQITANDILKAIERRRNNTSYNTDNTDNTDNMDDYNVKLALDLVDYFNRMRGRELASDQLAHAFKAQIQTSESALLFRSLLKKVATFNKAKRSWTLNPRFNKK